MARKYAIRDQHAVHFVTFTVVKWVDLFIRDEYRQIIVDSLNYCKKHKSLMVHAYCIMPSHIHLILSTNLQANLSDTIRDFKSYTSTRLKNTISRNPHESRKWLMGMFNKAGTSNSRNSDFQLWQQHNHPIVLNYNKIMDQRLDYVHKNPLKAGFVDDPTAWIWSSCASYEKGVTGLIDIDFIK